MTGNPVSTPLMSGASGDEIRRLHRSRSNRVFAGVCGGIAEHFGSDPTAVRLLTLIIGLFTGIFPMLVLYLIAAVLLPEGEAGVAVERHGVVASGQLALVFGALLVLVGLAGFANEWLRVDWDQVWPLVLIGTGALMLLAATRRH